MPLKEQYMIQAACRSNRISNTYSICYRNYYSNCKIHEVEDSDMYKYSGMRSTSHNLQPYQFLKDGLYFFKCWTMPTILRIYGSVCI